VNPYGASAAEDIEEVFPQGELVRMYRSYRSTWEISQFASGILATPGLIAMERHGDNPQYGLWPRTTRRSRPSARK